MQLTLIMIIIKSVVPIKERVEFAHSYIADGSRCTPLSCPFKRDYTQGKTTVLLKYKIAYNCKLYTILQYKYVDIV